MVDKIINELLDRRGFRQVWDSIDLDIQEEIKSEISKIINPKYKIKKFIVFGREYEDLEQLSVPLDTYEKAQKFMAKNKYEYMQILATTEEHNVRT